MSSPVFALPLRIARRISRGLAIAVVLPLDVAWWWKCLIASAVGTQAVFSWRLHVSLTAARAVHAVLWISEGEWQLTRADGTVQEARLRRASYVQPALVVLRFRIDGGGRCAVLSPADVVEAEAHRRLLVGLRLQAEMV